jgi:hypothetical protein
MSKKTKPASKEKRLREKQARKAANKALYASRARMGENTKSSRTARKAKKKKSGKDKGKHLIADCGNIACKKCYTHTDKGVYPKSRPFSIRGVVNLKRAA